MYIKKHILLIFMVLAANGAIGQTGYTLTVTINGFKTKKGTVKLNMQNTAEKEVYQKVAPVPGKSYQLVISNVQPGQYAINVFHDKNNNNKLDTNWLGIPTEGWGCSNDARGFMSAPSFKSKLITIKSNTAITINLVHY